MLLAKKRNLISFSMILSLRKGTQGRLLTYRNLFFNRGVYLTQLHLTIIAF